MKPRVKICCISSPVEARMAIDMGASALGLVSSMPSGPGVVSKEMIKKIVEVVPPPIGSFLLTSKTDTQEIIAQQQQLGTNTLQLVDAIQTGTYQDFTKATPGISIVQVIHVLDESNIDEALEAADQVDALLLDSGNPNLKVKVLGGTGKTHNWDISKRIVDQSPVPVFLAGGLNAGNVKEAVETVRPFGLDLCSSVRTDGHLDPIKLELFFEAVNKI